MKKIFLIVTFISFFSLSNYSLIKAQTIDLTNPALPVNTTGNGFQNGDIVCSDGRGYILCDSAYTSSIFGVINTSPATDFRYENTPSQPVISDGETSVRVTSANGDIHTGDFITTSSTPGVGELSTQNGYVIGTALANYSSQDKSAIGTIKVAVNIKARTAAANPRENLLDLLRSGLAGIRVSPIAALRYLLAALMVLVSFTLGFVYFGRIARTGVEAIGRNPLARTRIQLSVIINIAIMLIVSFVGLAIGYLILAI